MKDIHLWRGWFSNLPANPPEHALLSVEEQSRAAAFKFPAPQRRFIAGRAALRRALAWALAIAPQAVTFAYGEKGKPALDPTVHPEEIHFNVSHSHDLLLIVVAGIPCGIDAEHARPLGDPLALAQDYFTDDEYAHVAASGDPARTFFRLWTRKEAYSKAMGDGFGAVWNSFSALDGALPKPWQVRDLAPAEGYFAATAFHSRAPLGIEWHEMDNLPQS
jgi:4'-phosphopantetheinyl transferase